MSPFNPLGSTKEQEDYTYTKTHINKTQRRSGRRTSQPSYKKNLHNILSRTDKPIFVDTVNFLFVYCLLWAANYINTNHDQQEIIVNFKQRTQFYSNLLYRVSLKSLVPFCGCLSLGSRVHCNTMCFKVWTLNMNLRWTFVYPSEYLYV